MYDNFKHLLCMGTHVCVNIVVLYDCVNQRVYVGARAHGI